MWLKVIDGACSSVKVRGGGLQCNKAGGWEVLPVNKNPLARHAQHDASPLDVPPVAFDPVRKTSEDLGKSDTSSAMTAPMRKPSATIDEHGAASSTVASPGSGADVAICAMGAPPATSLLACTHPVNAHGITRPACLPAAVRAAGGEVLQGREGIRIGGWTVETASASITRKPPPAACRLRSLRPLPAAASACSRLDLRSALGVLSLFARGT